MNKHLNIRIYGKVQGVFFRDSARKKALDLGITGFVRNEPDGSVYAEAEGGEEKLAEFLAWCRRGPEWAEVKRLRHEFSDKPVGFEGFEVRH